MADTATAKHAESDQDHEGHASTLNVPVFIAIPIVVGARDGGHDGTEEQVVEGHESASATHAHARANLIGSVLSDVCLGLILSQSFL